MNQFEIDKKRIKEEHLRQFPNCELCRPKKEYGLSDLFALVVVLAVIIFFYMTHTNLLDIRKGNQKIYCTFLYLNGDTEFESLMEDCLKNYN